MKKQFLSLLLALVLCLSLTVPAFAATVYVQYTETTDDSGALIPGSRTAPAGEEDYAAFCLSAEDLEEVGSFYETEDEYTTGGPFPVYRASSPVTVTLTEGMTKDEVMKAIAEDNYEGAVASLCVHKVAYDETNKSISVQENHTAFFDGMVHFNGKDSCTIQQYYSLDDETFSEYFSSSPSIEIGASVTLSEPGTYHIFEYWINTFGAQEALIIISDEADNTPADPKPETPPVTVEDIPASGTAYASAHTVTVDGKEVEFQMYALKDAKGNLTNYIKLRDVAAVLSGTKAQFEVGWNGSINLETGKPYTPNGSEMIKNFEGDQPYKKCTSPVNVNGAPADLEAITLTDAKGGEYNYFKLRDLGAALGFNVSWIDGRVVIASNEPYSDAQ